MKKMFACLLLVVMVLSLVACGKHDEEPPVTDDSAAVTQTEDITPTPTAEPVEEEVEELDDWYLDGYPEVLYGPNFEQELGGYGWRVMGYDAVRCLVFNHYENTVYLADAETGSFAPLSGDQVVVDYTVAYDTVYWYNLNREVWCSDWESEEYAARLYCEDAIAVSPHTDECEGAVVTPDRANWEGYGLPIYSPYGI